MLFAAVKHYARKRAHGACACTSVRAEVGNAAKGGGCKGQALGTACTHPATAGPRNTTSHWAGPQSDSASADGTSAPQKLCNSVTWRYGEVGSWETEKLHNEGLCTCSLRNSVLQLAEGQVLASN